MKKLILFLSAVCLCAPAAAQQSWKTKGFEPQVRMVDAEGIDFQRNLNFGADFVAAYRFNEIIRLGGGIGIEYVYMKFDEVDEPTTIFDYFDGYFEGAMTIPLFANVKVDFLRQTKVSPYFTADCGYSIFVPFSEYAEGNKLGMFVRPAFGVDIRFSKCTLFFEVGYKYQARSFDNPLASYGSYHQLSSAIGVAF